MYYATLAMIMDTDTDRDRDAEERAGFMYSDTVESGGGQALAHPRGGLISDGSPSPHLKGRRVGCIELDVVPGVDVLTPLELKVLWFEVD